MRLERRSKADVILMVKCIMNEQTKVLRSLVKQETPPYISANSKRVTDHLANERTFLAWMRTGLATITFGFVVERFGLLLRELGLKNAPVPLTTVHYSSVLGIALTILGVILIVVALVNFLHIRR